MKMRIRIVAMLLVLALVLLPIVPVVALTTQDVTVTATPSFISISNSPDTFDFGIVAASATLDTTQAYFTVTNSSSVPIDVSIKVTTTNWTGGAGWIHDDTNTPGADTVGLSSSNNTAAYDLIVKYAAAFNNLTEDWPATTNFDWELQMKTPTSFLDGVEKENTVRLTATASS